MRYKDAKNIVTRVVFRAARPIKATNRVLEGAKGSRLLCR